MRSRGGGRGGPQWLTGRSYPAPEGTAGEPAAVGLRPSALPSGSTLAPSSALAMRLPVFLLLALALSARVAHAQVPASGTVTIGTVDSVQSSVLKETRKVLICTPPS